MEQWEVYAVLTCSDDDLSEMIHKVRQVLTQAGLPVIDVYGERECTKDD